MENVPQWLITLTTALILAVGLFLYIELKRRQHLRISEGKKLVEMWDTGGGITEKMYPFKGKEIYIHKDAAIINLEQQKKVRSNVPRYFFSRDSVGKELWPYKSGILKVLSVKVDKIIYFEGNPEPISRRRQQMVIPDPEDPTKKTLIWVQMDNPIVTPELLGAYRDESFALWSPMYDQEIDNLKNKLLKALAHRIEPKYVYAALSVSLILFAVSLYLYFDTQTAIEKVTDLQNIKGI